MTLFIRQQILMVNLCVYVIRLVLRKGLTFPMFPAYLFSVSCSSALPDKKGARFYYLTICICTLVDG